MLLLLFLAFDFEGYCFFWAFEFSTCASVYIFDFVDTVGECSSLLQACAFCRGDWWLLLLSGRGGSRGEAETERDRQL